MSLSSTMSLIIAALVLALLPPDVSAMIQPGRGGPKSSNSLPSFTSNVLVEPLFTSAAPEPRECVKLMVGLENADSRFAVSLLSTLPGVMSADIISRGAGVALLEMSPDTDTNAAMESIKSIPGIRYVEEDIPITIAQHGLPSATEEHIPNDRFYFKQYALSKMEMPQVWKNYGQGDGSVVVCVIDTGVDYTHPDLEDNMWVNPGEIPGNGIDDDGNGYIDDVYGINAIEDNGDPMDDHDHGTHCAGIIGAVGNNTKGVVGVNWNVKIMGCKFLTKSGGGFLSNAIKCVEYARLNGAHLTSNSYGCANCYSQAMYDVISLAEDENQLFIAAAGNSNVDVDLKKPNNFYPSGYKLNNVISVASSDEEDKRSSFSNYGSKSVDLAAPGSRIISTVTTGGGYKTFSGTSMACPHVAGAAALMMSTSGIFNDHDLMKDTMMGTVDSVPDFDGKTVSGGRLNVFKALDTLMRTRKSDTCCEDLPFNKWVGSRLVCGDSKWPGKGGACVDKVTWQAASESCRAVGARLCTVAELKDGETDNTGCGFNTAMIWTSDSCGDGPQGGYVQARGMDGSNERCRLPTDVGARRCCADSCQVSMSCPGTEKGVAVTASGVAVKDGKARCMGSKNSNAISCNAGRSIFVEAMLSGGKSNVMCVPAQYD